MEEVKEIAVRPWKFGTKKNTGKHWALFFFWSAVMATFLYLPDTRQWFWLILPFVCTEFAKAMDIM